MNQMLPHLVLLCSIYLKLVIEFDFEMYILLFYFIFSFENGTAFMLIPEIYS